MKMIQLQALQTFLSRLSKREKAVFYITMLFVVLVLLDRLIVSPIFSHMRSLDRQIQEAESGISRNMKIVAQKDRIIAESAHYASYFATHATDEEEMTALLKEIENLASKSSAYLVDLKPVGLKSSGTSKKYQVNLNCEAQMEQIAGFMYAIENSNKLLTIERYQISPKAKESSIAKCSLSISKMAAP